ncbi:MAG TPA: DUF2625 family protein [Acidimicrobiales bacterium]|nr:DUF2625 family protein [Acidimicrobiales bacterium]
MRTIEELRDVDDPAWPVIQDAVAGADEPAEVVPGDVAAGEETLLLLQVTARSFLGALALHTGGLLVDHGWLRILGGGRGPLNLCRANGVDQPPMEPPGQVLVAFDVLGGKFAINGGAIPGSVGEVAYFAPDDLAWLPLEMKFSEFVLWSLTDRLAMFYEHLRWPGWEAEVAALALDQGLSLVPPPFTTQGQNLSKVSRQPIPIAELMSYWEDVAEQLKDLPDGGQFYVNIVD